MEIGRAFRHPGEKGRQPRMGAQRLDGVVIAGQFGLGKGRVDLVVADLVKKHGRAALAAPELGRQVMQALLRALRDRALAERADGQVFHAGEVWGRIGRGQGHG